MAKLFRQYAKLLEAKRNSSLRIQRKKSSQPLKSPADRILFLQRTIGNQAVQRLIKSGTLQAKLKIGQPGDKYEQEADRVADAVMRMPEQGVQRQVEPEVEEEEELQAKATSGNISDVNPHLESQIQSLKGGGQPLSENDRTYFEPRFGRDFSQVRVHTDTQAVEAAQAVNARAFTFGQDVIFGTGQYTPGTIRGNRLLAHELTHVVQQGKNYLKNTESPLIRRKKRPTTPELKILGKPLSYWRRKFARQGLSKRVLKYLDKPAFFLGKLPLKAIIRSKGIDIIFKDGGKIYVDRSRIPLDAYLLKKQIKAERERLKKKEKWYMTIIRWLAPKPTLESSVKHRADWELSDRLFIIRKIAKGWSLKAVLAKLRSLNIANFKFIVISASVVPFIAGMGIMRAGGRTTGPARIRGTSGRPVGAAGGAVGEVVGPLGKLTQSEIQQAIAASGSRTVTLYTKLTQAPIAGRAISFAMDSVLAQAARSSGRIFVVRVPKILFQKMEYIGLITRSKTLMGGATGIEIIVLPQAAKTMIRFLSP